MDLPNQSDLRQSQLLFEKHGYVTGHKVLPWKRIHQRRLIAGNSTNELDLPPPRIIKFGEVPPLHFPGSIVDFSETQRSAHTGGILGPHGRAEKFPTRVASQQARASTRRLEVALEKEPRSSYQVPARAVAVVMN